jgi:type II secretory pathway component PulK
MTKKSKERGSGLIFALLLVFVLTVMGASMMFLSRSETWSSLTIG